MKHIDIYTDGACKGNPGVGGYGTIIVFNGTEKEFSGGCKDTTNNRMELLAAITGLEALKEPCDITLYSDSKYLVDSINKKWVYTWKQKNWIKSDGKLALNVDLWERILKAMTIYNHNIEFVWVKGHAGHIYNERCDILATKQAENI